MDAQAEVGQGAGAVAASTSVAREVSLHKRPRVGENVIRALLLFCGVISIITTAAILIVLVTESINFFQRITYAPLQSLTVAGETGLTLSSELDAGATAITFVDETGSLALPEGVEELSFRPDQFIQVENEIMQITELITETVVNAEGEEVTQTTGIEVARGVEGTDAAEHVAQTPLLELRATPVRPSENISADATAITLNAAGTLPIDEGDVIEMGVELLQVTAISGNTLTVERGVEGTVAAPHNTETNIEVGNRVTLGEFFGSTRWQPIGNNAEFGIWALVSATFTTSLVAILVATPLGLGAAIYLSEYASPRVRSTFKPILELLAGVPTVVYGFFALSFVQPLLRSIFGTEVIPQNQSMLAAGLVMGFMILPTVSSVSEDALSAVPRALREASYGLGATRIETTLKIVVPAAISGIVAAFILGIARAVGETMIVAVASGGAPLFTFNPFEGAQTMTGFIAASTRGELSRGGALYNSLFGVGLMLFLITLVLNIVSRRIIVRFREAY